MIDFNNKESTDIIFLCPINLLEMFGSVTFESHLGISYILAYLKEKGFNGVQLTKSSQVGLMELTREILEYDPKVLGFFCCDANYHVVKSIARYIKKTVPHIMLIAGGPSATFSDEIILKDSRAIDICVRGEGEYTTYELLENIRLRKSIKDIAGISYLKGETVFRTPDRPLIGSDRDVHSALDVLPSPFLNNIIPKKHIGNFVTSRGCVYKCTFCNFSALSRWKIRYHSIGRVIAELNKINNDFKDVELWQRPLIKIFDDNFSIIPERAKNICREIIKNKIELNFATNLRSDKADYELIELMQRAGFSTVSFSLESASPRVLASIGKAGDPGVNKKNIDNAKRFLSNLKRCVNITKEVGMNASISLILGLPSSTKKDDENTLQFAKDLGVSTYMAHRFSPYPGTTIFKKLSSGKNFLEQTVSKLPYKPKYNYKIDDLYYSDNAHNMHKIDISVGNVFDMISGVSGSSGKEVYPDVFIFSDTLEEKAMNWLLSYMPVAPKICFVSKGKNLLKAEQSIRAIISKGFPGAIFPVLAARYRVSSSEDKKGVLSGIYDFSLNEYGNARGYSKTISVVPFSKWKSFFNKKNSNNKIIFKIEKKNDLKMLKDFISGEDIVLDKDILKVDSCFEDECKWCKEKCPALDFSRIIINNGSNVKTCFSGENVAKTGDSRSSMIKKLAKMHKDVQERRGCSNCIAKNNCSKCLFPAPFTEKQYCSLKQNMFRDGFEPEIIFNLLKFARTSPSYFYENELFKHLDKLVYDVSDNNILMSIDGKKYVYDEGL